MKLTRWLILLALTTLILAGVGCGDDAPSGNTTDTSVLSDAFEDTSDPADTSSTPDTTTGDTTADTTTADTTGDTTGDTTTADTTGDTTGDTTDTVDPPVGERVVCPETLPMPTSGGVCDVEVTTAATHILLRGNVLAGNTIYEGGSVLIEQGSTNNNIVCVGCDCAVDTPTNVVTCAEGVISPGLINGHDHIRYNLNPPADVGEERFDHRHDWRRGRRGHTSPNVGSPTNTREAVLHGEIRMLLGGATGIAGSISSVDSSGLLRNFDRMEHNEGLGNWEVNYATFPLGDIDGVYQTSCDGFNIASASKLNNRIYLEHVAEGIDAEANIEFKCTSSNEANGVDLLEENTSIIHGIGLTASDITLLSFEGAKLVWSARTNISLYGNTAPITLYKNAGVNISLGTDWSASGSMNMLRELQCADYLNTFHFNHAFNDQELWEMATVNSAISMGAEDQIGIIAEGMIADIAIFDGSTNTDYRAVIDAEVQGVALVLRGGMPLHGDANIIEALVAPADLSGCETLDVCGTPKRLCAELDSGLSLANIRAAVSSSAYDVFYCGTPPGEPSCVPFRPNEYTGVGSSSDQDGDGVVDADDNCPMIFNPPRPLEGDVQGDQDTDGIGDVCDLCPLNEGEICDSFDPNDRDGDEILNAEDNCPETSNNDQLDADTDGIGDACDRCPDFTDTEGFCPETIYDIKQGNLPPGTSLVLEDVVVTAIYADRAAFVQTVPGDANYDGPEYSGVYVYMPDNIALVQRGDRVTIRGSVSEFYGQIQVSGVASLTDIEPLNILVEPILVDPADIIDGGPLQWAYEAVLVEIGAASVIEVNPAAGPGDSDPTNEFVVTGGLKVDDLLHTIDPFPLVDDTFEGLVGVTRWANGDVKLLPRDAFDILTGPPALNTLTPAAVWIDMDSGMDTVDLNVSITRIVEGTPITVMIDCGTGVVTCPTSVEVSVGTADAIITLTGVAPGDAVITASYNGVDLAADVKVFDDTTLRSVMDVSPADQSILAGNSVMYTVTLDIPAGSGDELLTIDPGALATLVTSPINVVAGETEATFELLAGMTLGADVLDVSLNSSNISVNYEVVDAPSTDHLEIVEVYYDEPSSDDNFEWVKLYNGTSGTIDLSGYSLGNGGGDYTSSTIQLVGSIPPGGCFIVGGPTQSANNGSPTFDQAEPFSIQNSGTTADAVGLFNVSAASIDPSTVPIDAVIYGTDNTNNLMDSTGAPGVVQVGDAAATNSIRLLGDGTWEINPAPTPGVCPPY